MSAVISKVTDISSNALKWIYSSIKNLNKVIDQKPIDLEELRKYLPKEYYAKITEGTNGRYEVSFPDFPNIHTYGDTPLEAIKHAQEALNGCIESDLTRGLGMPKASQYIAIPVDEG